ncbi:MAG: 1-deoxy-D-xylulose-5-phosphate synthase [Candidatus Marinimicrobia bacterium]|nr:1-deoxy-D-xylulose-5-phosphate synthase [Candidatus Neomarinimicrobiota bacterium]MBT3681493.1 1-deoxy-D-xylulose-5-phosphate synthase [Candidatus Neomarinimicrobiota bacterium]MBT3758540.1 1-deoxy-D-xylulose-5-phosphate synthase [Candidatus Neomarinimicrobiota bacterium]MBT3894806.1 1-deoxy-D-xylulose-5-phosphate synthase [Candidatus Neomarinimicrobiota bacterium]MBT4171584.1 1-deoxy-D-xylulose-5-phosphate synthase [Candidatus Neomarinimicrobiota bacterium]
MIDYIYLNKINGPDDLKKLSIRELNNYCTELSHFIRSTVEDVGGHYSSPLGVVDLSVALHYVYNTPTDKFVWDVGHQAYAHKIITGRRDAFHTLRQKDGISGFLKRSESDHDAIGAGHASTAISSALGIAHGRDKRNSNEKVLAIVGDGAMTGGLSFEGLNNLGYNRTQLTVVLNDNSLSISKSVGALSRYLTRVVTNPTYNKIRDDIWSVTGKIPSLPSKFLRTFLRKTEEGIKGFLTPGVLFEEFGLRYVGPVDGHNLELLIQTFNSVKDFPNPTLVHVYTKKGKGSELAEIDSIKYYSLPGKNTKKVKDPTPDYSKLFGHCIRQLAKTNKKISCITAAMAIGTGMKQFTDEFPDRYIDVGIAEGHAVSYASGLATQGFLPVVAFYSTFMQRAFDNIFHDVLLQELPVIFCMDRSGLVGPDGPTHHGVFDIALLRTLPGLIVSAPMDGDDFYDLLYTATQLEKPFAIRYPKATSHRFDKKRKPELLEIGKWKEISSGSKIVILAVGSMVQVGMDAVSAIKDKFNISVTVVNARFIKPLDTEYLDSINENHSHIITIEEGVKKGGFGSSVLEYFSDVESKLDIKSFGIPDEYIEQSSRQDQLNSLNLSVDGILSAIQKIIGKS